MNWQLAEAKNRFSEVVRQALSGKVQRITSRNEAVIMISEAHYQQLIGQKPSLVDYLMSAPSLDELDLERDRSPIREVDL